MPANDDFEEIKFQYERLRAEILQNDIMGLQILGATLLIVGAIISFALNDTLHTNLFKVFFFTGGLIVSIAGMVQDLARVGNTYQLAAYMREFLEPKTEHLKWETRLHQARLSIKSRTFLRMGSIQTTFLFLGLANFIFTCYYSMQSYTPFINRYFDLHLLGLGRVRYSSILLAFVLFNIILIGFMVFQYQVKYNQYVNCHKDVFGKQWRQLNQSSISIQSPPTVEESVTSNINEQVIDQLQS